jgi:hypothetical protein
MTTSDGLSILAILLSPLIALEVQRYIDIFRERRVRKKRIFETLMTTRRDDVSQYHVQALNMIDIDFYGIRLLGKNWRTKKEKNVLTAWKTYLDHLNTPGDLTGAVLDNWVSKKDDLLADMLYEISIAVGYDFDKVYLKRSIYLPRAHGNQFLDNEIIRHNLAQILDGKKPLPMRLVTTEETQQEQKSIQNKYVEILDGNRTIKVELINNSVTDTKK